MKKHSKKIVSLMLALLMVFSLLPMSSISALAAGSNSPVAVQADDTVTAAPAPVFYSVLTDLSRQSATYYADDSDKVGQLRVQLKYNPSDYNKNTLAILWQVSDDGSTFTDAEGAGTTMSAPLVSTYVPKVTVGQTKYYRAIITNKGLQENMTPTVVTTAIAKICYKTGTRPRVEIDKAMLRQSDGTLVSDDSLSKVTLWGVNGTLPKRITNIGSFSGNLAQMRDTNWDTDTYLFRGWQIGDRFFDGTCPETAAVAAGPNEVSALKGFLTVADSDWHFKMYQSPYQNRNTYYLNYEGTTSQDGALKVCHITPVFEKMPAVVYQLSLVQTTGGTVSQVRDGGETHTLIAEAASLYKFVRWEQSGDGGETWIPVEGDSKLQVTLDKDMTYRAIFESPYKIENMQVAEYALPSSGNNWYVNMAVNLADSLPSNMKVTFHIYDGESISEEHLLGEYKTSFALVKKEQTLKAKAQKRPSGDTDKILVVAETETGDTAQAEYQLKGTLDATASNVSVDTIESAFLEKEPAEVQTSVSGNPEVKSVFWSSANVSVIPTLGTDMNTCAINESTGLITYNVFSSNRPITFTAKAGDGRIADVEITFKGGMASKISEKVVKVLEGESKEYQAVNTSPILSVSSQKVSVKSSDESIFTAEILTRAGSQFQPKDIVDKIKINGVSKGKATLTIDTNGKTVEYPVVIQNTTDAVKEVTLSDTETNLIQGDSKTLQADVTPETAVTTLNWSSSAPDIVSVKDGRITGLKVGNAVITVTATDALGNRVEASCEVTVTEQPYNVEVYVPKGILAANGLKFAPSAGLDKAGHDIFDTEQVIADVSADTELYNAYDVYTMTLYPGTYSYRAVSAEGRSLGGGAFTFPDSQTSTVDGRTVRVFLRQTEVSLTNEFDGQKAEATDFSVQLKNDVSTATMGDSYVNADGYTVYPTLLSANKNLSYYLAAIPSDAYVKAHNVMASRTQGVAVTKDTSILSLTEELKTGALTINAPADAEVAICEQMTDGQIAVYKADSTAAQEDGTVDSVFHVAMTSKMYYHVSGASYVTYNGTTVDGADSRIVVSTAMLKPSGNTKTTLDRNTASNGGANMADLYLNVNAQGYLKLEEGNTFKLNAKRNWWGSNVTWVLDKDYRLIEPDFHYQVVGLDGRTSSDVITVGNDGTVKAVGNGTAIVLVTYDSMTLNYHDDVKYSYDNYDPNGFYGAIWPENTGVFVVSVGSGDSGITTGMTLNKDLNQGKSSKQAGDALDAELDPIYFTGKTGTYTFTPETEDVSVSVANPAIGNDALSFSGFKALAAEKDGSYNVPLTNGRNIVKLEKDGKAEYQVITAKHVTVKVNGQDLDQAVVAPGEKVSVTFDTLFNPVTRMRLYNTDAAAIYNEISGLEGKKAGNLRGSYGYYFFGSTGYKQTVENFVEAGTDSSGYNNPIVTVKDALIVPEDYSAEHFVLSKGTFNVAGFGGDYGAHRAMVKTWENLSPNTSAYMGQLPDISIPVGTLQSIEVTAQPTKTSYYVGEKFDASGMKVTATYKGSEGNFTKEISNYSFAKEAFATSGKQNVTISYTLGGVTKTADVSVDVKDVVLEKLEVVTPPVKTSYRIGEKFDATGMVVTASYNDGSVREITDYKVTPDTIAADTDHVLVTYGGKAASVAVTVNKVASIAVTKAPNKTEYEEGNLFNPTGMVVTVTYQDGSTEETTAYSYAPKSRLTKEDKAVTITYTGKDAVADLAATTVEISVKDKQEETAAHITAYVSYSDKGIFVSGSEGTLLWNAPVTVYDRDGDGQYTMSDVFRALHEEYYYGGADGYADTDSGWITRFWGVNTGMVSYVLNHAWVYGTQTAVNDGDQLGLFVYANTIEYSDLYTWFDETTYKTDVNAENSFTVNGLSVMNSGPDSPVTAAPANATVTVYDENGNVAEALGTKTDEHGQFKVTFPKDGKYTIEVSGTCTYTCSGYGGSGMNTYKDATVVPTRCTVLVGTARGTLGDINDDGVIDLTDAAQLLDKVTAGEKVDTYLGDINGDGTVDLMDVADLMDRITEA